MENINETVIETLNLLEARLNQILYHVFGDMDTPGGQTHSSQASSIVARIAKLEKTLGELASKSPAIYALLNMRKMHTLGVSELCVDYRQTRTFLSYLMKKNPQIRSLAQQKNMRPS
jgi:hypothetical protein